MSPVEQKNIDTATIRTRQKTTGEWEVSVDGGSTWYGPYKSKADAECDALEVIDREVQRLIKHAFSFK